jgi:hypothetical protein
MDHVSVGAAVPALAVDGLRRRHHDLPHRQLLADDQLVEQRGAHRVHAEELAEVGQVVLIGGEVDHRVDTGERRQQVLAARHVAEAELSGGVEVRGLALQVDRLLEAVEDADLVALRHEPVDRVGSDEAGAARDEDFHVGFRVASAQRSAARASCQSGRAAT